MLQYLFSIWQRSKKPEEVKPNTIRIEMRGTLGRLFGLDFSSPHQAAEFIGELLKLEKGTLFTASNGEYQLIQYDISGPKPKVKQRYYARDYGVEIFEIYVRWGWMGNKY